MSLKPVEKGHKILIPGNHYTPILTNKAAQNYPEGLERMMYVKEGDRVLADIEEEKAKEAAVK